jgi:hypothetical protein
MSLMYARETLTQYLLGSTDEADTERFDELSCTDDQFVEALEAVEAELVDAYVRGELTGAQTERFTSHYLASPIRRERVALARALQTAGVADAEPSRRRIPDWLAALAPSSRRFQWGYAALVIALLVAGGALTLQTARLRQALARVQQSPPGPEQALRDELERQRSQSARIEEELTRVRQERDRLAQPPVQTDALAGPGIVALALAPQTRGVEQAPTLQIGSAIAYVALQLDLGLADHPAYIVALVEPSTDRPIWQSGTIAPRSTPDGKVIDISLRAAPLKSGVYLVRVAAVDRSGATDPVGDYPFRVSRE